MFRNFKKVFFAQNFPILFKGGLAGIILFLFFFNFSFAYTCPDYFFATDLAKGATSPDVHVIQEILNLDKRTLVAYKGPGSPGNETNYFGVGTREALKRFQALFIEYIGTANGKFGPKTRTSMNAVCKGPFFTGNGGNVYDTGTSGATKDVIPPIIGMAGPTSTLITDSFRAFIGGTEPLKTPSLTSLIITNATAGDVRKISSTTYSFLVTPNSDASGTITLQAEAGTIFDLAGNSNDNASNEWDVTVIPVGNQNDSAVSSTINLPDISLPIPTPTDCSNVVSVDINDYTNPCYGRVPIANNSATDPNQQSQSGGGGGGAQQIMQMLQGLLKSLTGAGGAGGKDGGGAGGDSMGACTGEPTTFLTGKLGNNVGRYGMGANIRTGNFFQSNNGTAPPLPIYGFKKYPDQKTCQQSCPGTCLGGCCKPESDMTGLPVRGEISGNKKAFDWSGFGG